MKAQCQELLSVLSISNGRVPVRPFALKLKDLFSRPQYPLPAHPNGTVGQQQKTEMCPLNHLK